MRSDLLSNVLSAVKVEEASCCLFDLGAPWAVKIDYLPLASSWTVMEGVIWVIPPIGDPLAFHPGDTFLWPRGITTAPYIIASSPDAQPTQTRDFWQSAQLQGFKLGEVAGTRGMVRWGDSGLRTTALSMLFGISDGGLSPLITALPELIFVRASQSEGSSIYDLLGLILEGDHGIRSGFPAITRQVAQSLCLLVLRAHTLSEASGSSGWLAGLGDRHISRALSSIHCQPEHGWTVDALARIAGLSRSVFMERFLACVGQTPKRYLRAWRMHLAREALAAGTVGVGELVHELGYHSEAAFRSAFRNVTGHPPREFRRQAENGTVPKIVNDIAHFWGIYNHLETQEKRRDGQAI